MIEQRITIPYKPREVFKPFHSRAQRFAILVAHRRAGKTVSTLNDLIRKAVTDGRKDGRYAYVAPYYHQAKQVAWDYAKQFAGPIAAKISESELSIEIINGARIRLYGADNPDSLRGIYLDGVVLDEVADMREGVWSTVIRPALADRQGWATWIGTPKGHDAFYEQLERAKLDPNWFWAVLRASDTGILDPEELKAARLEMTEAQFAQEFECSFEAAIVGAIYGDEIGAAHSSGRIGAVPYDPTLPVETFWDLGVGDATAIWFAQQAGAQVRIIDHYETGGAGLDHFAQVLSGKGYHYGRHVAPHDIMVRELGSGKSRLEIAASLGIAFDVAPKLGVEEGINAAKMLLPRCYFDAEKCKQGLEALAHYRRAYDDKNRTFRPTPVHDWSSHTADAWRYLAVSLREPRKVDEAFKASRGDRRTRRPTTVI